MRSERRLEGLISVGPAMLRDFDLLGIHSVSELAKQDPGRMYGVRTSIQRLLRELLASQSV